MGKSRQIRPRITTGSAKNRQLEVPRDSRPLTERTKLAIFDTVADYVLGANVLDIYAGSGNMGIEALSRGAASAVFVDSNKFAAQIIKDNILKTGFSEQSKVFNQPAVKYLRRIDEKFDLIFADPPFLEAEEMKINWFTNVMHKDTILVLRLPSHFNFDIPDSLEEVFNKNYGRSQVAYLRKAESD